MAKFAVGAITRSVNGNVYTQSDVYEAALAASKPEWDGEGLPTVGCECEYETNGYGIKKVRVECITMDGIAFTWLGEDPGFRGLDCINTSQSHRFRPIRSEADKKRDIIISKIEKAYKDCPHSDAVPQAIYEAIAEHIRID
ncbi:hypothetical protein [Enterobacter asburiae]|uniref:hypothetical protein n=1 Tax=Enterobacter asburiae TaxID=61645 RepID=UPI0011D19E68|nr:hypothetical protein [Enterobacter asburiae]